MDPVSRGIESLPQLPVSRVSGASQAFAEHLENHLTPYMQRIALESIIKFREGLRAFFEIDAISRRLEGPRAPLDKEDLRARMALLQGAYPDARVPRLFHKELNNFFVAPAGGWRALGRRSRRAARGDVAIE